MNQPWPTTDIDPIRRLRVLAAGVSGAVVAEGFLPEAYEEVWARLSDLERELPRLVPDLRWLRITRREGDRLEVVARGHSGLRARFDAVLRPGWCFMQSRFLIIGMAAAPAPGGTALATLAAVRVPGCRAIAALAAPLYHRSVLKATARLRRGLRETATGHGSTAEGPTASTVASGGRTGSAPPAGTGGSGPQRRRVGRRLLAVQNRVVNPLVVALAERGWVPPTYALVETVGRRTGRIRRVPVANGLDGDTFWLIAALGEQAAFVRNIRAEPRVRVRARPARLRDGLTMRWRSGTAHPLPDDDASERHRQLGRRRPGYRLDGALLRALGSTNMLTVRIDLD